MVTKARVTGRLSLTIGRGINKNERNDTLIM